MHRALLVALGSLLVIAGGCAGPEPSHFDPSAADGIHHLALLPMRSADASVGAIASGVALSHLNDAALPELTVTEAPALWRLSGSACGSGSWAAAAGRQIGADAVLTGTAQYRPPMTEGGQASAAVTVEIVAAGTGACVYRHSGQGRDPRVCGAFRKAIVASLGPFQTHLSKSRKKP